MLFKSSADDSAVLPCVSENVSCLSNFRKILEMRCLRFFSVRCSYMLDSVTTSEDFEIDNSSSTGSRFVFPKDDCKKLSVETKSS